MKTFTFFLILTLSVLSVKSQFYFTGNPNNPALKASAQESWDDGGVFTPHIQYSNGTYYMFYAGWSGQFGNSMSIGLASSEDGFNFSKVTTNTALFSPDGSGFDAYQVSNPVVTYFENKWTLFYASTQSLSDGMPKAIGRATSDFIDGPYNRVENPILETGSSGEWDSHFIMPASVIYSNGTYFLYYLGTDFYPNGNNYIGLATSTDGLTWTKYDDPSTTSPPYAESDPVLMPGSGGSWDESMLWGCSVHQTDNGFEMFYGGISLYSGSAIGYATSTNGITWVKAESQNPLFKWTDDSYAVSNNNWVIEIPSVVYNESVAYLYYDYGPVLGEIGMAVSPVAENIIYVPDDQPTIQQGIDASTDGDLVLVDEGTYFENIRYKGKAITVASHYILDGDSSHITNTVIDGSQATDPDSAACVMFVDGEDTTSVIRGFTLTGGSGVYERVNGVRSGGGVFAYNSGSKILSNLIQENEVDGDSAGGAGIGIFMDEGAHWAVIRHNIIRYNSSTSDGFSAFGGGISTLSNAIITDNIIEFNDCSNSVNAADGAGIESEEWLVPGISCEIRNNFIRNNTLDANKAVWGAGISANWLTDISISNNTISNNIGSGGIASWGGGVFSMYAKKAEFSNNIIESNQCISSSSNAGGGGIDVLLCDTVIIFDNEINRNSVFIKTGTNYWGGGILIDKAKKMVIIHNNKIDNNELTNGFGNGGHGGGISFYCISNVEAFITSNQISNNYSDYRGGGFCARNLYRAHIENNLFKNNESFRYGGAIMLFESAKKDLADESYHPVIANNNFVSNDAEYGGAIYSRLDDEVPVIFNSLFCNNTAEYSSDIYHIGGTGPAVYNNLIDTTAILTQWTGNNNIYCDAGLIADSLHLDYSSQCLNAGTAILSFDGNFYPCPDEDIDGEPRPFEDTNPDIGADEAPWFYVNLNTHNETILDPLTVYPNPFTSYTKLVYKLNVSGSLSLTVFNHLGELVGVLIDGKQTPGKHSLTWQPDNLPAGVYYSVLKTNYGTQTTKMIKLN